MASALEELADSQIIATADSAAAAVSAVEADSMNWELIVIDLYLREGTGLQVLRAVESRGAHQHAVVLTNFATPEIRKRAFKAGADYVFDKSLELASFLDQCRKYSRG